MITDKTMLPGNKTTGVILEEADLRLYESAYEVFSHSPSMISLTEAKPISSSCHIYGENCEAGMYVSESITQNMLRIVNCAINVLRRDRQEHYDSICPIIDLEHEDTTGILELIGGEIHHDNQLIGRYSIFAENLARCLTESSCQPPDSTA